MLVGIHLIKILFSFFFFFSFSIVVMESRFNGITPQVVQNSLRAQVHGVVSAAAFCFCSISLSSVGLQRGSRRSDHEVAHAN